MMSIDKSSETTAKAALVKLKKEEQASRIVVFIHTFPHSRVALSF